MVHALADGEWSFDFMVHVQTDAHRMPIEDATVKWPERLPPCVPVARLQLPRQRFDSGAQLAFADTLSYNPWHSLAAHQPLGNQNRARKAMNPTEHVEPTGAERFPGSAAVDGRRVMKPRAGRSRARSNASSSRPDPLRARKAPGG